jgi:cytochrome c oxidase subunit 3
LSVISKGQPSAQMRKFTTWKLALGLVLGAETVFFFTLVAAYVGLRTETTWAVSHTLSRLAVPALNTAVLLASAAAAYSTQLSAPHANRRQLRTTQGLTLALGVLFIAGQVYEFGHAGLQISDQAFGGVFFALMSFHGVHVLAGLVLLGLNIARCSFPDFSAAEAPALQIGSLFWYYVVGVWLVLFAALYLL